MSATIPSFWNKELIQQWTNERIAIAVTIFIGYFFHYLQAFLVYSLKLLQKEVFQIIEKLMYLFGIAGLLSLNYLQSGIYQSILAFCTLISLLAVHILAYKEKMRSYIFIVFYFFLFLWYSGIIFDYYYAYKSV